MDDNKVVKSVLSLLAGAGCGVVVSTVLGPFAPAAGVVTKGLYALGASVLAVDATDHGARVMDRIMRTVDAFTKKSEDEPEVVE